MYEVSMKDILEAFHESQTEKGIFRQGAEDNIIGSFEDETFDYDDLPYLYEGEG